ncbi:MAG TPA: response regulator transcription factor [Chloroflexota bacterium]|nr:response regulator transcription factor [Chloroflexota bacterium]
MSAPGPLVLVVDDEPLLAQQIAAGLQGAGYRTVIAATGAEALALLTREAVDLAILDLGLPDANGLDICKHLRATRHEPYLPVLILTAAHTPQERLAGFAAGADDYVIKPFHLAELLARVGVWLDVRRREAALRSSLAAQHTARLAAEARAARAQAALQVVRTFIHSVNQALAEVVGYAELLAAGEIDPALVPEYAARIAAAGRELGELTHQFAELATHREPAGPSAPEPLVLPDA